MPVACSQVCMSVVLPIGREWDKCGCWLFFVEDHAQVVGPSCTLSKTCCIWHMEIVVCTRTVIIWEALVRGRWWRIGGKTPSWHSNIVHSSLLVLCGSADAALSTDMCCLWCQLRCVWTWRPSEGQWKQQQSSSSLVLHHQWSKQGASPLVHPKAGLLWHYGVLWVQVPLQALVDCMLQGLIYLARHVDKVVARHFEVVIPFFKLGIILAPSQLRLNMFSSLSRMLTCRDIYIEMTSGPGYFFNYLMTFYSLTMVIYFFIRPWRLLLSFVLFLTSCLPLTHSMDYGIAFLCIFLCKYACSCLSSKHSPSIF